MFLTIGPEQMKTMAQEWLNKRMADTHQLEVEYVETKYIDNDSVWVIHLKEPALLTIVEAPQK